MARNMLLTFWHIFLRSFMSFSSRNFFSLHLFHSPLPNCCSSLVLCVIFSISISYSPIFIHQPFHHVMRWCEWIITSSGVCFMPYAIVWNHSRSINVFCWIIFFFSFSSFFFFCFCFGISSLIPLCVCTLVLHICESFCVLFHVTVTMLLYLFVYFRLLICEILNQLAQNVWYVSCYVTFQTYKHITCITRRNSIQFWFGCIFLCGYPILFL